MCYTGVSINMSPAMVITTETTTSIKRDENEDEYLKGVKHLSESGITKVPNKYILPLSDRPAATINGGEPYAAEFNLKLPVIDFTELQGPSRSQVLDSIAYACENYGFFQVCNY